MQTKHLIPFTHSTLINIPYKILLWSVKGSKYYMNSINLGWVEILFSIVWRMANILLSVFPVTG